MNKENKQASADWSLINCENAGKLSEIGEASRNRTELPERFRGDIDEFATIKTSAGLCFLSSCFRENKRMKVSKLIFATAIIVAACLLGCTTTPSVNGRFSYLRSTDLSKFKSFHVDVNDENFSSPESAAHFREGMTRALSAKGLAENPENPDFVVVTAPVDTYVEEYWYAGNIRLPMGLVRVNFEPASGGLNIYEAVANTYFEPGMSQEHKNSILDETIRVILMEYPPGR